MNAVGLLLPDDFSFINITNIDKEAQENDNSATPKRNSNIGAVYYPISFNCMIVIIPYLILIENL